jgi:hypothetical protein
VLNCPPERLIRSLEKPALCVEDASTRAISLV